MTFCLQLRRVLVHLVSYLLVQVLRLVYCLVNYGYYGNGSSLQQLLEPLMNVLDGSRDLPFPTDYGNYLKLCDSYYVSFVWGV